MSVYGIIQISVEPKTSEATTNNNSSCFETVGVAPNIDALKKYYLDWQNRVKGKLTCTATLICTFNGDEIGKVEFEYTEPQSTENEIE